jgi:hypothetical protein
VREINRLEEMNNAADVEAQTSAIKKMLYEEYGLDKEAAAPAAGGRVSEAVQAAAKARTTVESQTGASGALQPEIEQTAQR